MEAQQSQTEIGASYCPRTPTRDDFQIVMVRTAGSITQVITFSTSQTSRLLSVPSPLRSTTENHSLGCSPISGTALTSLNSALGVWEIGIWRFGSGACAKCRDARGDNVRLVTTATAVCDDGAEAMSMVGIRVAGGSGFSGWANLSAAIAQRQSLRLVYG